MWNKRSVEEKLAVELVELLSAVFTPDVRQELRFRVGLTDKTELLEKTAFDHEYLVETLAYSTTRMVCAAALPFELGSTVMVLAGITPQQYLFAVGKRSRSHSRKMLMSSTSLVRAAVHSASGRLWPTLSSNAARAATSFCARHRV